MSAGAGAQPGRARLTPAAFLAALRISRRAALRARGRTALIVTMIALPVLVITVLLTLRETVDISPREGLTAQIGAADLRVWTTWSPGAVTQDVEGNLSWNDPGPLRGPRTAGEIMGLLGPGARIIPANDGSVEFRGADGYDRVSAHELDLRDPLTKGMYRLLRGRLPATPGEVAVTAGALEHGFRLGGTVEMTPRRTPMRVVGVIEPPHRVGITEAVGLPGTLLFDKRNGSGSGWLADTPAPLTRDGVRKLNGAGLRVQAPAVVEHPEDYPDPVVRYDVDRIVGIGLAGLMIVLETVLLAGPAFAVGLRRRRRELALIAAQGGSPRHLRMIVLADGLALGGGAALIGLVAGVGLASLAALLEAGRLLGAVGPLDIPWMPVAAVALLGAVSGLVAAVAPAVQAARQNPAAVLGGRRDEARARRAGPLTGLVVVVAGVAAAVFAVRFNVVWVFAAALLSQLGLVALTPWLVGAAAGPAGRLPLPFRLAARDASRNRGRTAFAVAAVMTATAAFTAAGVAASSGFAHNRDSFQAALPAGTTTIRGVGLDDDRWAALRAAVERELPGVPMIEAVEPRDARGTVVELGARYPAGSQSSGRFRHLGGLPVGDEQLLTLVQGRRDPAAVAALAAGKAVVFDPRLVRGDRLGLTMVGIAVPEPEEPEEPEVPDDLTVPAVVARAADPGYAVAVLPPSALHRIGLKTESRTLYVDPAVHRLDYERGRKLERELRAVNDRADVYVELGFQGDVVFQLRLLLVAASILVLGGTFVATGLAAADLRPDLATMAAVGAAPGTRRLVVAGQAGFIAGLGVPIGAGAGLLTGIAAAWPMTTRARDFTWLTAESAAPGTEAPTVEIPWLFLTVIVIGLPPLAALLAGAFARTRVTLTRRIA
ncbi:putative ABC transport system permease protein [Streptosporangium becharense]|uniref:Putative ABC transport system permease protein n=1 Tax=Streptosporangium becharense TaxID=1816182 RepID=A0A7W9MIH0_9ACTN|nr:FtsX-like permease family protein [Streptosporangium becharense]MBB2913880.1 putative ABC transport system permease protein [Streptosporangium becharense]MBB5821459.1 putative ABC transport system permease protein [Streptosporangium becharense]